MNPATTMVPVEATTTTSVDLAQRYRDEMPGAVRLAYLITGDHALAEDLAQEAFMRVSSRLLQIREAGAFRAYLRRAVVNATHSHFRHQRVVRAHADRSRVEEAIAYNPDTETHDELWRALNSLPDKQRAAIVCRYWLDLSEKETAHALACRPGTVKSLLSRGLDAMRAVVEAEGGAR